MDPTIVPIIEEYTAKAQEFSSLVNKSKIKEYEHYFEAFRRGSAAFSICCAVISSSADINQISSIMAAQSLFWVSKKQLFGFVDSHTNDLLDLLSLLERKGAKISHPVITQICLSIASLVLHALVLRSKPVESLQSMFDHLMWKKLPPLHILKILSILPELTLSLRDELFPPCNKDPTTSSAFNSFTQFDVKSSRQHDNTYSVFLLKESLLKETRVVLQSVNLTTALLAAGQYSDSQTDLFRGTLQCATQWIQFIATDVSTAAHSVSGKQQQSKRQHSETTTVPALDIQLFNAIVSAWLASPLLGLTAAHLSRAVGPDMFTHCLEQQQQFGAQHELLDDCVELVVSLCETAAMRGEVSVCAGMAAQVLPLLTSILSQLSACSADKLQSLFTSPNTEAVVHCDWLGQLSLAVTRLACSSAVHLLCTLSVSDAAISEHWSAFVKELLTFQSTQLTIIHSIPSSLAVLTAAGEFSTENCCLCAECVVMLRQCSLQLTETSMSFWLPFIAAVYSAGPNAAQLQAQYNTAVESVVVLAIRTGTYLERPEELRGALSLQHQEEFSEYRSFLRETLRELVDSVPSIASWLVQHAVDSVSSYCSVERGSSGSGSDSLYDNVHSVSDLLSLGSGWALSESLLHALTAITKCASFDFKRYTAESGITSTGTALQVFGLLQLLTGTEQCRYCRPLARMGVVLISELLPNLVYLTAVHGGSVPGLEVSAVQTLFRNSVQFLLQSVTTHQEQTYRSEGFAAPANDTSTISLGERVEQRISAARQFHKLNNKSNASTATGVTCQHNLLHFIYQGWFLVFRVKQDHIGAVSLCKLFASAFNAREYGAHTALAAAVLYRTDTQGWRSRLPDVVADLKQMHMDADQLGSAPDSVAAAAGCDAHMHKTIDLMEDVVSFALSYSLYYLTVLQKTTDRHYSPCITAKSFNLVYFALCTALCSEIPALQPVDALCSVGQIAAPLVVALLSMLMRRRDASHHDQATVLSLIQPLFAHSAADQDNQNSNIHAAYAIGVELSSICSLSQLVLMLNELVVTATSHWWGESAFAGKKNPGCAPETRSSGPSALLLLLQALQPVLDFVVGAGEAEGVMHLQFLSFPELEAFNKLLMATSAVPNNLSPGTSPEAAVLTAATVLTILGRQYDVAVSALHSTHQQTPLFVQATCQLIRSLCSYSTEIDIAPLFQRAFQQVSTLGIQALQSSSSHCAESRGVRISSSHNSMNIHRVSKRDKKQLQQLNDNRLEFGVLLLSEFWLVCLSNSELLPASAASSKAKSGSQSLISAQRVTMSSNATAPRVSHISVGLMGWPALQAIVDSVCGHVLQANYEATMCYGSDSDDDHSVTSKEKHGRGKPTSGAMSFGTNTWRLLLNIMNLVCGPVLRQSDCRNEEEGAEHAALLASLLGPDGNLTNNAAKSVRCTEGPLGQPELVQLIAESGRLDSLSKSLLCGISGVLPPDLREDLIKSLQKLYVVFGTQYVSHSVLVALFSADYPVNGVIASAEGKTGFVSQLQGYALASDWKRFKNIVKTLSKG